MSGGHRLGTGPEAVDGPRGRGRPSKINRDLIVAAARTLAPEKLTMQAVADALGVDRKALNYYVSDRDGLLELVALDAFESEFRRVDLPAHADWRQVLRSCATAMKEAFTRVGVLISYVRFDGVTDTTVLAVIERILESLVTAGLGVDDAGRAITLVSGVAHSAARETTAVAAGRTDPQAENVAHALETGPPQRFPLLRRLAADRRSAHRPDEQFRFDVELIIAGLERRLAAGD
ncbi:TetR/AcrR family transcriptional regulator C-terminal domain-containing protein [Nocardia sp. alder85J]|uniref:TetR/AcrR family transcriptional regulator C-terminal domain-containing protein n=1 Tax=Nocardia sp. alder85J TaxID=2862949 RepID=UPI001CD79484|nr:TetR/AcrR family transcriptional regulator C-terminal domain-containing protein [Nocardia sp. alder85J]MCX4095499.1 TetR/AcrR family transcriptional regulator C-terminal domain-containing protein [Nocardia sp. alder85J]